jgi:DNA-binding NarL/FixJ family response regulator
MSTELALPSPGRSLCLLIADDHEMVRSALRLALGSIATDIQWLEAGTAEEVEAELGSHPELDLALVDFNMPGATGVLWIEALRRRFPAIPLVVISGEEDRDLVLDLIGRGVAGFIPKSDSSQVILHAVRLVLSGGTYAPLRLLGGDSPAPGRARDAHRGNGENTPIPGITARQLEVLRLLARGLPNKTIARELGLSEGTVKVHLLAIYRVLGARNRTEAVVSARALQQAGDG